MLGRLLLALGRRLECGRELLRLVGIVCALRGAGRLPLRVLRDPLLRLLLVFLLVEPKREENTPPLPLDFLLLLDLRRAGGALEFLSRW